MRLTQTQHVRPGMVITADLSTRDKTSVRFLTVRPDGCKNGVHINASECWNYGYPVYVISE